MSAAGWHAGAITHRFDQEFRLKTATRGEPHSFGGASTAPADGTPDLRIAFALERRITPALFVLATLAALAAPKVGAGAALGWLAACVLNAAARFVLASAHENHRTLVAPSHPAARAYALSWTGDLLLWSLWLGARCGLQAELLVETVRDSARMPPGR
jgi:hypothetical protein